MKTLLLSLTFLATAFAPVHPIHLVQTSASEVYVCDNGNKGAAYHVNKACKGLAECKHKTLTMSEAEAKAKGYHLCGMEAKKSTSTSKSTTTTTTKKKS